MNIYQPFGLAEAGAILSRAEKFLVYYDPDVDGLIAGHFVVNLLKMYRKPYIYYINENRKHGMLLNDEQLKQLQGYTMVAVDFSIPEDILNKMVSYGIDVVNIDHHSIEGNRLQTGNNAETGRDYVVINNQYSFEPDEWRFLSGAGMVYYVFNALFPEWGEKEQNKSLIGITLLSDARVIENQRAYELLKLTYNWRDEFSKYLIDIAKYGAGDFQFGVQRYLDRNFIDFTLCPRLNALFRLNLGDVAVKLFEREEADLTELNRCLQLPIDNKVVNLTYVVKKSKAVQQALTTRLRQVEYPNVLIGYLNIDDIQDIISPGFDIGNFVGLTAGQLVDKRKKTMLLFLQGKEGVIRGSLRGRIDEVDYLNLCRSFGITCAGHTTAFGILKCDITDFTALSEAIGIEESKHRLHNGQIIEVENFASYVAGDKETPDYNQYVREGYRRYYKYLGNAYFETLRKEDTNYVVYEVEGVTVKCFDKTLTPTNGLILPVMNNGYVEYILRA